MANSRSCRRSGRDNVLTDFSFWTKETAEKSSYHRQVRRSSVIYIICLHFECICYVLHDV